jgi:hypothetical protein
VSRYGEKDKASKKLDISHFYESEELKEEL